VPPKKATTIAYAVTYGLAKQLPGCHPFIGAHYFMRFPKAGRAIMSVALFPTLEDAEAAHKKAKRKNPNAEIVPVNLAIEEIMNTRQRQKLGLRQ
jgi:hypothetical protein